MTTEQVTLLVGAIVGFLQVLTIAIGIWNKQHGETIIAEQKRVAGELNQVKANGHALAELLATGTDRTGVPRA